MKIHFFLSALFCVVLAFGARAEGLRKPVVREVSPGIFEVGKVRLDHKAGSISFAGTLKMKRGLLVA